MAQTSRITQSMPDHVADAMAMAGAKLRALRKAKRLTAAQLAQRLMISLPTLRKLERGDPTVVWGVFALALWGLGDLEKLSASVPSVMPGDVPRSEHVDDNF